MKTKKCRLRCTRPETANKGGNHSTMITDYRFYHPERDLSNGGFCNG